MNLHFAASPADAPEITAGTRHVRRIASVTKKKRKRPRRKC